MSNTKMKLNKQLFRPKIKILHCSPMRYAISCLTKKKKKKQLTKGQYGIETEKKRLNCGKYFIYCEQLCQEWIDGR